MLRQVILQTALRINRAILLAFLIAFATLVTFGLLGLLVVVVARLR